MLNLLAIQPGQVVRLKSGGTAEVVDNIGNGVWLKARMADSEKDPFFCEDMAGLVETTAEQSR